MRLIQKIQCREEKWWCYNKAARNKNISFLLMLVSWYSTISGLFSALANTFFYGAASASRTRALISVPRR